MGAESNVGACSIGGESSSAIIVISPLRGLAMLVPRALMTAAAEPAIIVMNSRRLIGHLIFGFVLSNYNHG
jgi:hypothetical protein